MTRWKAAPLVAFRKVLAGRNGFDTPKLPPDLAEMLN